MTGRFNSDITETTGPTWADPTHDAAGNMTGFAKPSTPTSNFTGIYDAWNRLVEVKDGANTVARYTFDGLGRRITKEVYVSGSSDHTDHFYYHGQSIVEVTVDSDPDPRERYVWGMTYIDELLVYEQDANLDGTADRYFALHNAQFNVEALADTNGDIVERYTFTPYGQRFVLNANWTADGDGLSDVGLNIGHQGLYHDAETGSGGGLIYNRARMLHPVIGRFMQRDPLGYIDGMSVYTCYAALGVNYDPSGLSSGSEEDGNGHVKPGDPNSEPPKIPNTETDFVIDEHDIWGKTRVTINWAWESFRCNKCCNFDREEGYCLTANFDGTARIVWIATLARHDDLNEGKWVSRTQKNYDRTMAHEQAHVDSWNRFEKEVQQYIFKNGGGKFYTTAGACVAVQRKLTTDVKNALAKWKKHEKAHDGKYGGPKADGKSAFDEVNDSLEVK